MVNEYENIVKCAKVERGVEHPALV
jgi:hypothetical protein